MEFKSISIKGFKSFGDRVELSFHPGVTAIVGPNGCGKSNVVDAIRWVLGEQKTRVLRSDKMENVIFNGSRNRKASNLAEVTLTFTNTRNILPTDYSEVAITRRYYRDGTSEYLINDVNCRLKDITDLFLDTGIGSDSYSIIELGMVDDILSNKDNARRTLLEEAAGIGKYRIRKKQTFQKLEGTEQDLSRVQDLLTEIEANLKSLESQARKARKYRLLKEDYRDLGKRWAWKDIQQFKEGYAQLESQEITVRDRLAEADSRFNEQQALLEQEKLNALSFEKKLAQVQAELNQATDVARKLETAKTGRNQRLQFVKEQTSNLEVRQKEIAEKIKEARNRLEELEQGLEKESQQGQDLDKELALKQEARNRQRQVRDGLREEALQVEQERSKLGRELSDLRNKQENARVQLEALDRESERMAQEDGRAEEELEASRKRQGELEGRKKQLTRDLEVLEKDKQKARKKLEKLKEDLNKAREQKDLGLRQRDALENEIKLLRSLVQNMEGYPESIRYLKKEVDWGKKAPLLSEVIYCPEELRVALEQYLEPWLNYYVVPTREQAFQGIELLGRSGKGRAHCFVLEALESSHSLQGPEGSEAAMEVVQADPQYRNLLTRLLGHVFIMSPEELKELPQNAIQPGWVLLSNDGKLARTRQSVSGGSIGLFEGKKIGRVQHLNRQEKKLREADVEVQRWVKECLDLEEAVEGLQTNLEANKDQELNRELMGLEVEYSVLESAVKALLAGGDHRTIRKADLDEGKARIQKEAEELVPLMEQVQKQLQELETKSAERVEKIKKAELDMEKAEEAWNQALLAANQAQNRRTGLERDIRYAQKEIEELGAQDGQVLAERERLEKEALDLTGALSQEDEELSTAYVRKETCQKEVEQSQELWLASRGKVTALEKTLEELRKNKEQIHALLLSGKEQISELKLRLNGLKERLAAEFRIDIEELMEEEMEVEEDAAELKLTLEKLREKLDGFGPVNSMAEEAFTEMKSRHDFIQEQRQDLDRAKADLLNTIKEIDQTARERFMHAFDQVRSHFKTVFRSLFQQEDSCDIILEDPSMPLESAIDIIAQPKGKKPLTINQLSGGEKTLTATALLFSLYLLKPAPFCIFDEVDAPLDDTNIDKFNRIIRDFSGQSQFILVTHNKRTIASTDVIYGITMVEQGISKVVPVDLREAHQVVASSGAADPV